MERHVKFLTPILRPVFVDQSARWQRQPSTIPEKSIARTLT